MDDDMYKWFECGEKSYDIRSVKTNKPNTVNRRDSRCKIRSIGKGPYKCQVERVIKSVCKHIPIFEEIDICTEALIIGAITYIAPILLNGDKYTNAEDLMNNVMADGILNHQTVELCTTPLSIEETSRRSRYMLKLDFQLTVQILLETVAKAGFSNAEVPDYICFKKRTTQRQLCLYTRPKIVESSYKSMIIYENLADTMNNYNLLLAKKLEDILKHYRSDEEFKKFYESKLENVSGMSYIQFTPTQDTDS